MLITLLYPLAILLAHEQVEPRFLAALLLLAALLCFLSLQLDKVARGWLAAALLLAAVAIWGNAMLPLKLYPLLVNAAMLSTLGYSLAWPAAAGRIARLRAPALPGPAIAYARHVTRAWCVFFIINGGIAFATALWASLPLWSLYNGVIAYCLMGMVFGCQHLARLRLRRRHHV